VDEKGQSVMCRESELEFEDSPLPVNIFLISHSLGSVTEKIEARFAYETDFLLLRQGGEKICGIPLRRLGMDAKSRYCFGDFSPQCLRAIEFFDIVGYDGASPIGRRHPQEKFWISFQKVVEMQMGVAVHGFIVAKPGQAVNGRGALEGSARKKMWKIARKILKNNLH
jgi:hypothetical protein